DNGRGRQTGLKAFSGCAPRLARHRCKVPAAPLSSISLHPREEMQCSLCFGHHQGLGVRIDWRPVAAEILRADANACVVVPWFKTWKIARALPCAVCLLTLRIHSTCSTA